LSAPAWLAILDLVQGSARELQSPKAHWQWLVPPAALPGLILPSWTVNWTDFSSRHVSHTATELACGLVAPTALIAGFIWRGRMFIARLKWELILLLVVLLLSMLPTAGLFRWSFRWLPFFHLVLAICAAEILHIRLGSPIPAIAALVLTALTAIAILILHTAGSYALPLTWIFFGLAATWCLSEFLLRDSGFHKCVPIVITFLALLATYLCIPTNCGVPRYNFSQELLKPSPLDPQRLYLSIYPWAELTYATSSKPQSVRDQPALLTFSRPYFRGYKARLGNQKLAVTSYRGLFPIVELPAGAHGRLILAYRPSWLMWGIGAATTCALIMMFSVLAASYRRTQKRSYSSLPSGTFGRAVL
jgi:hypothetical protein